MLQVPPVRPAGRLLPFPGFLDGFFGRGSSVMEVSIDTTNGLSVGPLVEVLPRGTLAEISSLEWRQGFDVNADGSKFLVTRPVDQATPAELHVLQNWAQRFRR